MEMIARRVPAQHDVSTSPRPESVRPCIERRGVTNTYEHTDTHEPLTITPVTNYARF